MKCFPPDDLHADEVGDLDVVLGPDAGGGGGEEHGGPGEGDKEPAGDEELQAVVPGGSVKLSLFVFHFVYYVSILSSFSLRMTPG